MKKIGITGLLLFAILLTSISFTSCEDSSVDNETISLTENEKTNLQFMREEEKLARDVYIHFDEKYDLNIFNNISTSEQYHMDAVLEIMEKYELDDPSSSELGVFSNASLQELYDDLISKGNVSLVEALKVGATIEDLDIKDLDESLGATSKDDIINMYELLKCGSSNHLRGFVEQLVTRDENYSPQFISQETYDEIINGVHEHCEG